MMKKVSSIPETIPRGPFTSIGCFHTAKRFVLPSLLKLFKQNKRYNQVFKSLLIRQKLGRTKGRRVYMYSPRNCIIIHLLSQMEIYTTH